MKDPAHHPRRIQRKILQEARKESVERENPIRMNLSAPGLAADRSAPEYEGMRFDPHHRKPRILKRMNFH